MYENDFFYAETPVPDVKFHVWNIQIHTSIQQRHLFFVIASATKWSVAISSAR